MKKGLRLIQNPVPAAAVFISEKVRPYEEGIATHSIKSIKHRGKISEKVRPYEEGTAYRTLNDG